MTKEGKTICVYSPKGGVGKTILSLNLAGVCAKMEYRVLLLDFAVHTGTLGMIVNEEIKKTLYHLTDDMVNNRFKKISDYIYKYNDKIDVLPAPKDPRQGNKISSRYLSMIIEKVRNQYDTIIIDTESIMDEINIVTLDSSDLILFVIDNDMFTLKNTRNILNIFNDCNITNYKVLLNASNDFKTPYFSIMDMKKIIGANIDYTLSKNLFMKDITSYLYECKIPSLTDGFSKKYKEDYNNMKMIIEDFKKGDVNEKN